MTDPVSTDEQPPLSLASRAIRSFAAHRESSLAQSTDTSIGSGYGRAKSPSPPSESVDLEYTSIKNVDGSNVGFWGALVRKAREILEDYDPDELPEVYNPFRTTDSLERFNFDHPNESLNYEDPEDISPKGSESISSSLNHIGVKIMNAFEEGLTIMENKTADIIQETKLQFRKKILLDVPNGAKLMTQVLIDHESQLKACRNVANAMAAKAKLLRRELKTFKADLAFAKERCTQLEEQNKLLRECDNSGVDPQVADLIQVQLETLVAEKSRLSHENATYARENNFLREVVDYYQLTMQDVVYIDDNIEEIAEVFPDTSPELPPPPPPEVNSPTFGIKIS